MEDIGFDKNLICRLIKGETNEEDEHRKWMFEIVTNKRNSFDVNKLDYLGRDSYHCGMNQQ
jgi:HD superfamily phosphohydrolase